MLLSAQNAVCVRWESVRVLNILVWNTGEFSVDSVAGAEISIEYGRCVNVFWRNELVFNNIYWNFITIFSPPLSWHESIRAI